MKTALEHYKVILKEASELYTIQSAIRNLIIKSGISESEIDLTGTGSNMMNSLLSYAFGREKLTPILENMINDFPNRHILKEELNAVKQGLVRPEAANKDLETKYKYDKISKLLFNAFSDVQLTNFVFNNFEGVSNNFAAGMEKLGKITLLLQYVKAWNKTAYLLELLKEENDMKYEQYKPYINGN